MNPTSGRSQNGSNGPTKRKYNLLQRRTGNLDPVDAPPTGKSTMWAAKLSI
ncbi:MAG: hypothetical protein OXU36_05225 [Candidatus Poribacteria bacterium]|nr:hypothetical protein [Candidatus Poribacteria bacterium]